MKEHRTLNIEHRTSNDFGSRSEGIGCSALDVGCWMFPIPRNTPCTQALSLLKTMTDAAGIAAQVARILLSTARSSFDELQNARKCGQKLYRTVESISWGQDRVTPNISGGMTANLNWKMMNAGKYNFSFRGFLREKHETNNSITQTSLEKGRQPRQSNE